MKKLFTVLLVLLLTAPSAYAVRGTPSPCYYSSTDQIDCPQSMSIGKSGAAVIVIGVYNVADIPASPTTGQVIIVKDGDSACDTSTGLGSTVSWHRYNGASWDCIGDGGAGSVQLDGLTDVDGEGTTGNILTDDGDGTYSFNALAAIIEAFGAGSLARTSVIHYTDGAGNSYKTTVADILGQLESGDIPDISSVYATVVDVANMVVYESNCADNTSGVCVDSDDGIVYGWNGSSMVVVGSAVWGSITGTLSNQTDLQNALDAKIAATGVTFENLNTNGDVGTGAAQVAAGDHNHSGVYEPAGVTESDISDLGTTTQMQADMSTDVPANETDPVVGAISGIPKANGAGVISQAVADTDYLTPGTAASTYQGLLVNEAGLYSALSDVSQFYEPGDDLRTNSGTSLPGTCTVGQIFLDTDADTNGSLYICIATDTWKENDDDGGAGGGDAITEGDSNLEVVDTGTGYVQEYTDNATDVADSGDHRLPNAFEYCWEASPAGNDICVGVNSSEQFYISDGGTVFFTASATGAGPSRTATPQLNFGDSDTADSDDNARMYANCTSTGSGAEDCDLTFAQQIAGTLTDRMWFDADGQNYFAEGTGWVLTDRNYIRLDGTADGMDDDEANGVLITGRNCGENLTQWDIVRGANDADFWHQADADAVGEYPAEGISIAACTDTNAAWVVTQGVVRNEGWTGLTVGGPVYLSTTAGGITQTEPTAPGTWHQQIGVATSDSEIDFDFGNKGYMIKAESIVVAASDETTDLTTGTAKVTFRMPYAFTVTGVRASVNTAPVGSTLNVDINEGGVSILSTVITIDASEETSTTAATPAVISDSSLADDAEITVDIDQIGSSTAGKGLKVVLIGVQQ